MESFLSSIEHHAGAVILLALIGAGIVGAIMEYNKPK